MGVGAAFVMPATLSILTNVFPPHERGKAIAVWAGISGGGAAIGPVASGFLLEHFSWGSVFLVNVPIIAFALGAGYLLLPKSRDPDPEPLDPIGALLSIAGLSSLVYAIIEAPHRGWASGTSLMWFGIAVVLVAAFLMWELRNTAPMLNLRYFLDPRFGVAAGVITLVFFAMFGFFFLLTQYFQLVLGYGTLEAGVKQLPFAAVMMVVAPQLTKARRTLRCKRGVAVGLLGMSAGDVPVHDRPHRHVVPADRCSVDDDDGCRHGDDHPVDDRLDHVGGADGQGRRGLGDERHHPRARRCTRCRRARQPGGVALRLPLVAGARPAACSAARCGRGEPGRCVACSGRPERLGWRTRRVDRPGGVRIGHAPGCDHRRLRRLLAAAIVYRKLPAGNPHAKGAASLTRPSADLAEL